MKPKKVWRTGMKGENMQRVIRKSPSSGSIQKRKHSNIQLERSADVKKLKRCFIISPIGPVGSTIREEADAVLNYLIRPALDEIANGGGPVIEAIRSDEMGDPGRIEEQMLNAILTYDFCIADLSGHNPNVFYELAIAQAVERPVVLLCRAGAPLPFDVKDYRTIEYDLKPKSIKEDVWVPLIKKQIEAVLDQKYVPPSLLKEYSQFREGTRSYLLNSESKEFGDPPKFNTIVRQTRSRCDLMGVCLSSWASTSSQEVLHELGRRKVPVRILIMDSDNPALSNMINEGLANESLKGVQFSARKKYQFFEGMSKKYSSFETRRITKGLPHAQIILTDSTALVLQYMYSRGTAESPLLQLPKGTELYDAFSGEFEVLWQLNRANRRPNGQKASKKA